MVRARQAETAPKGAELRKRAGSWLQERRKAAGLSQIELAARLGLKYYTFVSQVENGFGRVPCPLRMSSGIAGREIATSRHGRYTGPQRRWHSSRNRPPGLMMPTKVPDGPL